MREMTEALDTYDDQGDYDWDYDEADDRGPRPKILWGRVVSLVVLMFVAFLIGRWSVSGPSQNEYDAVVSEREELESTLAERDEQLQQAQQALANTNGETDTGGDTENDGGDGGASGGGDLEPDVYTVKRGDTLNGIIEDHYGCTILAAPDGDTTVDMTDNVTDFNQAEAAQEGTTFNPSALAAGQEILLPAEPTGYECPD